LIAGEFVESGHFYCFTTELVENDKVLQGQKCGIVEIPYQMCVEIDNPFDWIIAETVVKHFGFKQ